MFGFSLGEIIVISAVALLVLGPERIPQVARTVGRFFAELRRATDEVKREFNYSEFTKNNPPYNLNLPPTSGLRTASVLTESSVLEHPEPVSVIDVEPVSNSTVLKVTAEEKIETQKS
jgi:Tat protein translocase TatB subunit